MKKIFLLVFILPLFLPSRALADTQNITDSVMTAYYYQCLHNLRQPEILKICDTLYQFASEKKDIEMQGTAMVFTIDYYFSKNNLDSVKTWMQRIEGFARKHNSFKPFYFAWDELILIYIQRTQYALAQYEIEKLIHQAEADNYKSAIASAYSNLGTIYHVKGIYPSALEYYHKAADYILQNDLEKYTLPNIYSHISEILSSTGEFEQALEAIDLSAKYATDPTRTALMEECQRATIYAKMGKTDKALKLLDEIEKRKDNELLPGSYLPELRLSIYQSGKMYSNALEEINSMIDGSKKQGDPETYYSDLFEARSQIYAGMGNFEKAYDDINYFIKLYKEKISKEGESTLAEFATLMGVEQLNREKAGLATQRTKSIIMGLICILILAAVFIFVQRRLNHRLKRAMLSAEEANRMKGVFIRNITHEVNTPLNAIVGFTELLISIPEDDPERQGYIDIIHENSDYLQKLIDDTLYISDIESSNVATESTPADINECVQHALHHIKHLKKEQVEIRTLPIEPPVSVCLPKQYIIKVISELIRNAITFTASGHIEVCCSASEAQHRLTISVTDTGSGIPSGESEHIFERFIKLNQFSHGTGLGLCVCRMAARRMGGDVQLDTSYTGGARFLFTLPMNK